MFNFYFHEWDVSGEPDDYTHVADDVAADFKRGQDKLQMTSIFEDFPEGIVSDTVDFAQLDTDGDGVLDDGDAQVEVKDITFGGRTALSTVIDVIYIGRGEITIFGVTGLTAADYDGTEP
jgi:hypothetical protein